MRPRPAGRRAVVLAAVLLAWPAAAAAASDCDEFPELPPWPESADLCWLYDHSEYASVDSLGSLLLARCERELGPRALATGAVLFMLARSEFNVSRGGRVRAVDRAVRALAIQREAGGPDDPFLGHCHYLLAELLIDAGELEAARGHLEQAGAVWVATQGPHHRDVGYAQCKLGEVHFALGDLAGARAAWERAVEIRRHETRNPGVMMAAAIDYLGQLALREGDLAGARRIFEEALALREAGYGPVHFEVAQARFRLAAVAMAEGRLDEARRQAERALAIYREDLGEDHRDVSFALDQLARIDLRRGDLDRAFARARRSLAIRAADLRPGHPLVAEALLLLGRLHLAAGAPDSALNLALDGERIGRRHMERMAGTLTHRDLLAYGRMRTSGLDLALTALAASGAGAAVRDAAVDAVWEAAASARGMVLAEIGARRRVSAAAGVQVRHEELAAASRRYAALAVQMAWPDPAWTVAGRPDRAAALRRSREEAERGFARLIARERPEEGWRPPLLPEVRANLPPGAALVSYVTYEDPREGVARIAAFVQGAAGIADDDPRPVRSGPVLIPLGDRRTVEAAVAAWRAAVARPPTPFATPRSDLRAILDAGAALRRLCWDPLRPHLGPADTVLLVPAGPLALIPFAALPGADGSFLLETGPDLILLTAERDLRDVRGPPTGRGLLAVGLRDFPAAGARPALPALPAAFEELAAIRALWGRDDPVVTLTAERATVAAFRAQASGRRAIHLVTHGFSLPDRADLDPQDPRNDPLLRSGLVLATGGAPDHDDVEHGLLTAEDILALDLSGTELVVLSACDTGLGELREHEGVIGLRHALLAAGVRSVVAALWPVGDRGGRIWMEAFYRGWRHDGLSIAAAADRACLRTIAAGSRHPRDWAGFVVVGGGHHDP